jgi:selenide,water dikinase
VVPGGLQRNRTLYESQGLVQYDATIPSSLIDILYDPQTSGGLLVTLPAAECDSLIAAGAALGVTYVHIGTLKAGVGVSVLP